MSAHSERYPASSEAIRGIARRANGSATSINDLKGSVESAHRAALSEAAGDVKEAMQPAMAPFKGDASQVTRAAIWASCQLEEFADAIDVYDDTSSDPRSISKLNSAYENLDGDPLARGVRALDREKGRLDQQIDDAATDVATSIGREPTQNEIIKA